MTDRPILFSGPMVRAILDGRKTQTRRVIRPQPKVPFKNGVWYRPFKDSRQFQFMGLDHLIHAYCNHVAYAPGDRLWVRETWTDLTTQPQCDLRLAGLPCVAYRATDDDEMTIPPTWRPSIFMPRWASRLTLTVTDVRVQRLWDISEADAKAEGVPPPPEGIQPETAHYDSYTDVFADLWDSLNAKRGFGWGTNPWVCAVTFTAHQRNIDQMEAA